MRVHRTFDDGRGACLLTTSKPACGECHPGAVAARPTADILLVDDPLDQNLMYRDVIQVPERILQFSRWATKVFRRFVAFLPRNTPAKNSEA